MSDVVLKYFEGLNQKQKHQLLELYNLYTKWNEKVNLISRKDIDNLYIRHILHSLSIAKFIDFIDDSDILDVGTGGGFPSIPLAIFFPKVFFHGIDSIGKKINVAQQISEHLGLNNICLEKIRAEKVEKKYDFVVSRAVAPLKKVHQWTRRNLKKKSQHAIPNGIILLKGGDLTKEIEESGLKTHQFSLNNYFEEDFFNNKFILYAR